MEESNYGCPWLHLSCLIMALLMVSGEVVNVQCFSTWTQYNYLLVDSLNQYDIPQISISAVLLLVQSFQLSKTYMCLCVSEALLILVELGMTMDIKYQSCFHEHMNFKFSSFKQREINSSSSSCTITTKTISKTSFYTVRDCL